MKIKRLYLLLLLFTSHIILAQNDKAVALFKEKMKEQNVPGAQLVVIKNNKILLSETYGFANVPFAVPVKKNTIFSINSIAKVFTSVAVMQLQEQNKLRFDDEISHYVDSIPESWKKITIKQLLSHTSGLPDIEDEIGLIGGKGQDFAWNKVKEMPFQSLIGEKFNYNATNYFILQRIIEKCSKVSFETFVRENQFKKAKLTSIFYSNSYDVIKDKSPTYSYYNQDKISREYIKGDKLHETYEEFPSKMLTDAGAFTTAEEMAKWIIALQSGELIKTDNIKTIWEPVKLNDGSYGGFGDLLNAYALGWPVIVRPENPAVAPLGGGRAAFITYPKDNLTIILFTNLTGIGPQNIADEIGKIYLNDFKNKKR